MLGSVFGIGFAGYSSSCLHSYSTIPTPTPDLQQKQVFISTFKIRAEIFRFSQGQYQVILNGLHFWY